MSKEPEILLDTYHFKERFIDAHSFAGQEIKSVIFTKTVGVIREGAFRFNNIWELHLPNNITKVQRGAFANNKIVRLMIGNGLKFIDSFVFSDNELEHVELPDTIYNIGISAFQYNKLTEIVIPKDVTRLMSKAFADNYLVKICFADTVHKKTKDVFKGNGPNGKSKSLPVDQEWIGVWKLLPDDNYREWVRVQ